MTYTIVTPLLVDLMGIDDLARSLALLNLVVGMVSLSATPLCGMDALTVVTKGLNEQFSLQS